MRDSLKEIFNKNYYLLTSVLMFLSFPSYDVFIFKAFPFFAWFAFVPLLVYVRNKTLKEVYFYAFISSLFGNFFCYRWIGQFGGGSLAGYAVILVPLIPFLSMYFGLKIVTAEFLSRKYENYRILIYPAVWILIDWMQSIGYLAFPWPCMAYSQYPFTWFIQSAAVIGAQGITFFIIIVNYSISVIVLKKINERVSLKTLVNSREAKLFFSLIVVIIVMSLVGFASIPGNRSSVKEDVKISVIQSCISPWDNWRKNRFSYLNELKKITDQVIPKNPDLVIWSESATLETISYDFNSGMLDNFGQEMLDYVRSIKTPLISGEIGIIEDYSGVYPRRYPLNSAVYINNEGDVIGNYAKIHLVPFGEWFPYEKWFPLVKQIQTDFGGSDFVPGDEPELFSIKQYKFCVLICYEGIFQRLCREYKKMGAQFFVNITNDGWTDTYSGHMQHFAASIFRAIENGMWYVRAGNTGYSTLIDPYGRIVKSMPILKKGSVTGDLDISLNRNTLYSYSGDLILQISMVFIAALFLMNMVRAGINIIKKIR